MKHAIGIFDSGVGGLTVYKAIRKAFPHEHLIYFGDTARVPYGPKSAETIIDYSVQNARFLLQQGIKILVVACNTSSAVAIPFLQKLTDIPIIGVIEPGSKVALSTSKNKRIGIIGTEGTIKSGAYSRAIKSREPNAEIVSAACPLFVPIVEEGWQDNPIAENIVRQYLEPLLAQDIDTLVLGCTHYPLLKDVIQKVAGQGISLVDSADAIAKYLTKHIEIKETDTAGTDSFYVSDNEEKFARIAQSILGTPLHNLRRVSLFESWFID